MNKINIQIWCEDYLVVANVHVNDAPIRQFDFKLKAHETLFAALPRIMEHITHAIQPPKPMPVQTGTRRSKASVRSKKT